MSMLAGAFRHESATAADEAVRPWKCLVCSTDNDATTDDPPLRCMTCQRLRNPLWLCLEDSGLQIALGSRVLHTNAGGSQSAAVIVAVDYVQKVVTLLRVKVKRSDGQQDDISFHEVALNASQLQQQLEPLDDEQEDECGLDDYGICGECRGVFRVVQGDRQSQYANEDRVNALTRELQQLSEQKQRLVREKAYDRVLKCTEQGKFQTKQLLVAKRELEFLNPVFCPFCGWSLPRPAKENA